MNPLRSCFMAIMLVGCLSASARALNDEEIFSQFQFNFITPGARATAMSGAFIGLADDATAVESNPAGLTQLLLPEVSAEFKYITYTAEQIYENRSFETNITRKEFDDAVTSIPFVSAVYPLKRIVFSVYRQELVNYTSSYRTNAYFIALPETDNFILPIDASVDITSINYGLGTAIRIFDSVSLAISPRWSRMKIQSHSTGFLPPLATIPTDFSENAIYGESLIDDDDTAFSVNAGILWNPHPRISIGAVYRRGPTFTVTEQDGRNGWYEVLQPDSEAYDPDLAEFTLKIPDTFGIGVAWRVTDFLTVTLDEVYIRYEDLLKDFDVINAPQDLHLENNFTVENATELHVGLEYLLMIGKRLLALRAGVYTDPDHTIRYTGSSRDNDEDKVNYLIFPGGDDQVHYTGGVGLVFSDRFQIDTAVNISERMEQFSISSVYRFGGGKPVVGDRKADRSAPVEEEHPSLLFTVVKVKTQDGDILKIQRVTTETPGVSNLNATITQNGKREFVVTAALEKEGELFLTEVRIKMRVHDFAVESGDDSSKAKIMSQTSKSVEVMVRFNE